MQNSHPDPGGALAGLVFLLILFGIYCLPGIVASMRHRQNAGAIWTLNIFLGWTLLFWVLSLVWAVSDPGQRGGST